MHRVAPEDVLCCRSGLGCSILWVEAVRTLKPHKQERVTDIVSGSGEKNLMRTALRSVAKRKYRLAARAEILHAESIK